MEVLKSRNFTNQEIFGRLCTYYREIDMLYDCASMSINFTLAPQINAQLDDATKEFGVVQTISFFFKPRAMQDAIRALVQLLKDCENLEFVISENFFSKIFVSFPCVKKLEAKTFLIDK